MYHFSSSSLFSYTWYESRRHIKMNAVCYGFRSFGQLNENTFDSILKQIHLLERNVSVKFITFSWSRCYVILDDNSVFVQGFINSSINNRKKKCVPFTDSLKKMVCLKRYDLFLTDNGSCWKCSENEEWTNVTNQFKILNDRPKSGNNNSKVIDIVSNGDEVHLELLGSGNIFCIPVHIELPVPFKVKKVSCGVEHNICLLENGSVYVWGSVVVNLEMDR